MLKTILSAAAALTLISGAGLAETDTYSRTTTQSGVPAPDGGVSKSTHSTTERNGVIIEKDKNVTKDMNGDVNKSESTTVR